MINVEIIKVHVGKILPCGRVIGNKEFTIGGLIIKFKSATVLTYENSLSELIIQLHACQPHPFGVMFVT